jgi:hypothetical protein
MQQLGACTNVVQAPLLLMPLLQNSHWLIAMPTLA